ncbi:MAG: hypothetical protein F6K39_30745 [Okeania sp. SIO3B3]|nr:hypothetical protein [Okeania sp. SIO3B3]
MIIISRIRSEQKLLSKSLQRNGIGGKAEGTYAGGRRKEKVIREKVFLSRYYPDMILIPSL